MRLTSKTFQGDLCRSIMNSPVGKLTILSSPKGIRAIVWEKDLEDRELSKICNDIDTGKNSHAAQAMAELGEYFAGSRTKFSVKLDVIGSDFQRSSWNTLKTIPFGRTYSYEKQALKLGSTHLARAVGQANARNPVSIIVPCHRAISKSGAIGGFAGGLDAKRKLLKMEGHDFS